MLMNDEARKRWHQYAKENLHIDPGTRWKQFYELNKEELDADYKKIEDRRKEKAREYYKEHKAEINAKKDPEKEKERYARYYEQNKDKKLAYDKAYYEKNKDRINEDRYITVECPCGGNFVKHHQARHKQTKKHLKWLEDVKPSEHIE
jgi:hypothetical protein